MKKTALLLAISATLPGVAAAADMPTVYGKVNVSVVSEEVNVTTDANDNKVEGKYQSTLVKSNASRLGVKGKYALDHGLTAIYKAEYQINVDEKNNEASAGDSPFKQRNIFGGIKGDFGTVKVGYFDTAVKKAQKKIDLFNDLQGDIKNVISNSEKRKSDTVQYSTPKMAGVQANVAYLGSEQEDGKGDGVAASLTYSNDSVYVAYAYGKNASSDVKGEDITEVNRVVAQVKADIVTIGALYETQAGESGWVTSAKVKATSKLAVKAQYGQSSLQTGDKKASSASLGADYKVGKKAKLYAFATQLDYDQSINDEMYVGTGLEIKF